MPENNHRKTILELKKQLSEIPTTTDFFRKEREKLEVKITACEIMSTPAANDFLKDLLEEKKKLLPEQGFFSFAQILTREQFYRRNRLPVEINNSIEAEVWDFAWEIFERPTDNSFIFFLEKWLFKWVSPGEWGTFVFHFSEAVETALTKGKVKKMDCLIKTKKFLEKWQEELELNQDDLKELNLSRDWVEKTVEKKNKLKIKILFCENEAYKLCFYLLGKGLNNRDYVYGIPEIINLAKKEQKNAEQTKEIQWLLRVLRKDIGLAETAPAGLKEQQEFLRNHFKREFEKLHANNPQLLAEIVNIPWFKFHPLYADLPREIKEKYFNQTSQLQPDEPDDQEREQQLAQLHHQAAEIRERIRQQAQEVSQERVYNPPLDMSRETYQAQKVCTSSECQTPVFGEQIFCAYHRWEIQADQRLNAQRAETFPNSPRRNEQPAEDQSRYHTTIEDESETNEPEETNENISPNPENNQTENRQDEPSRQPSSGENEPTQEWWENIQQKTHSLLQTIREHPIATKVSVTAASAAGIIGGIWVCGKVIITNQTVMAAINKMGTQHFMKMLAKTGLDAGGWAAGQAGSFNFFQHCSVAIVSTIKGIGSVLAAVPVWGWCIIGAVIVIGIAAACYIYWNDIKAWFGYGTQQTEQAAERINDTILENEYVRSRIVGEESESERGFRQANREATQTNARITELQNQIRQWQDRWETQSQIPTETQEEQTERENHLRELREQLTQLNQRINDFSEDTQARSRAKEEQWQAFRHKADKATTYGLYIIYVLAIILAWKLISKFFSGLFHWAKKKNDETLEKIHQRIEVIAAKMQAQALERQAERQQADQEAERIKNQITTQKLDQGKNQLLTKEEPKAPPQLPETPPPQPAKKTLSQRERDRKNAKRRAKYHLKKMLTSATKDNQKNDRKTKKKPKKNKNKK